MKKIVMLAMILALCLTTQAAIAADTSITLGNDAVMIDSDGSYILSGTGAAPIVIASGVEATITLRDAAVAIPDTYVLTGDIPTRSAIHAKPGAIVTLVLNGTNTLTAGPGGAGIYVEAGWDASGNWSKTASAQLTVQGTGSLTVTGGKSEGKLGAGAGIGGAGVTLTGYTAGGDFGSIVINGGTVHAVGGNAYTLTQAGTLTGAGAGIGGGGISICDSSIAWTYSGSICISNGNVTAEGGESHDKNGVHSGAAGIGGGCADSNCGTEFATEIVITGGKVEATGGACGAGIGGGNNGNSGAITITGGEVTAVGGADIPGTSGGAGIGGGHSGKAGSIHIGGTAKVVARGADGSAGVGSGGGWWRATVASVLIDGSADVTATGGSNGGAGIGSGNAGVTNDGETIILNTTGTIVANGGRGAEGVGVGELFDSYSSRGGKYIIQIGDNCEKNWLCNERSASTSYPAFDGLGTAVTDAVWYTRDPADPYPAENTLVPAQPSGYQWKYVGSTIFVLDDAGSVVASHTLPAGYPLGNWACLNVSPRTYTITWVNHDGMPLEKDVNVPRGSMPSYDGKLPVKPGDAQHSYVFAGWEPELTPVTGDQTYTAKFSAAPPVNIPQTGDNSRIALWGAMLMLSAAGMVILVSKRRLNEKQ